MSATHRRRIIAAIHDYGRARAKADFTLGSDLDADDVAGRVRLVTARARHIDMLIAIALGTRPVTVDVVRALQDFGVQLYEYGSARHAGASFEAARDALDALDVLLALAADRTASQTAPAAVFPSGAGAASGTGHQPVPDAPFTGRWWSSDRGDWVLAAGGAAS